MQVHLRFAAAEGIYHVSGLGRKILIGSFQSQYFCFSWPKQHQQWWRRAEPATLLRLHLVRGHRRLPAAHHQRAQTEVVSS